MNILPVSSAEGGDRFFVQAAVWKSEYGAELLWLLANATDQPEVERRAAGAMLPSWRVWCFLFFWFGAQGSTQAHQCVCPSGAGEIRCSRAFQVLMQTNLKSTRVLLTQVSEVHLIIHVFK